MITIANYSSLMWRLENKKKKWDLYRSILQQHNEFLGLAKTRRHWCNLLELQLICSTKSVKIDCLHLKKMIVPVDYFDQYQIASVPISIWDPLDCLIQGKALYCIRNDQFPQVPREKRHYANNTVKHCALRYKECVVYAMPTHQTSVHSV